jgi:two-component system phosphate regulon sensor histidine kinase PhoR
MTDQPPSPPPRRAWSAAWTGAVALLALLALALSGRAEAQAAALAGAVVASAGVWQTVRAARARRAGASQAGRAGPSRPEDADAPYAEVFERLPDPAMLVSGGDADDPASRRVLVANAAARELLRIPREGALLVSALRHPEVLEALDESLFGGLERTSSWSSGGVQDRVWRAWSAPAPARGGEPRALLIMHEETDVRRAERTRADFLANASHELRTPLASLAGFVETLRGHARHDDEARERFLSIMAAQAERMARLVDDILSLSRVELNEHVPPSGLVDLSSAVRDVCDALAPLARRKGVALEPVLPPGPVLINGDRDGIVQVVQNLVDNGLNYSATGTAVRVDLARDLDAEAAGRALRAGAARLALLTPDRVQNQFYAAVRVSDSGPGIEREHLPRLTERFYRVAGQKSGERPGTGLGLAIVRHIVNRHRGGLAVDSTPGEGSTFVAWFPLASHPEREQVPTPEPPVATKVS